MEEEWGEMIKAELKMLYSLDPYSQPGLWDQAVDTIRAIRATIWAKQNQDARKRFSAKP